MPPVYTCELPTTLAGEGTSGSARPMVARLAADFYPMDNRLAARPGVKRLMRRPTLMWAVLILAQRTATFWLVETQSVAHFVLTTKAAVIAVTMFGVAVSISLSVVAARRRGMLATA